MTLASKSLIDFILNPVVMLHGNKVSGFCETGSELPVFNLYFCQICHANTCFIFHKLEFE